VTVCGAVSPLVQVTVVPTLTISVAGSKAKYLIATAQDFLAQTPGVGAGVGAGVASAGVAATGVGAGVGAGVAGAMLATTTLGAAATGDSGSVEPEPALEQAPRDTTATRTRPTSVLGKRAGRIDIRPALLCSEG
jgi:hypothetical protein